MNSKRKAAITYKIKNLDRSKLTILWTYTHTLQHITDEDMLRPTEKQSEENFKEFFKKHQRYWLFGTPENTTNHIGEDHYSKNKKQ